MAFAFQGSDGAWRHSETGDQLLPMPDGAGFLVPPSFGTVIFAGGDATLTHNSTPGTIAQERARNGEEKCVVPLSVFKSPTDNGFIRADGMICDYNPATGQMEPTGRKWRSDEPEADAPAIVPAKGE